MAEITHTHAHGVKRGMHHGKKHLAGEHTHQHVSQQNEPPEPPGTDPSCEPGFTWNGTECVPIEEDGDPTPEPDPDPDPEEHPECGPGTHWSEEDGYCVPDEVEPEPVDTDVRDALQQFLIDNELPISLMGFITEALAERKTFAQIVAELRQTPEYLAAYPENAMRAENGYSWMPEAQIRAYRNEARRITSALLKIEVSNSEIADLIAGNVSLSEWEQNLGTWKKFLAFGPTVKSVFEEELGYTISDDRAFAFLAAHIPTPDLDRAWEDALYRGRPAVLGLGIRPDEEASLLRRYGIDVDQAFAGYQGIVSEMPRTERLTRIEEAITGNPNLPSDGSALFNSTPFATLFRAIQLNDASAIATLREQMARELARFSTGGGAAFSGTQAVGLLTPEQRAAG